MKFFEDIIENVISFGDTCFNNQWFFAVFIIGGLFLLYVIFQLIF